MKKTAIALATGMLLATPVFAQADDEIARLLEQVRLLQQRLGQVEREAARAAQAPVVALAGAAVLAQGDIPKSWKLPGTNTSVSIGGQVVGTLIVSSRGTTASSPADTNLVVSAIPLGNATDLRKNYWKLNAQESMLRVRTFTPTDYGPITSFIEGDFYGPGGTELGTNGHGFRLRHAWFTLGNFGAGQNWSNAVNLTAYPEQVYYGADIGSFNALRQAGFRYTQPLGGVNFWSASLENPESVVVVNSTNNGAATVPDNDKSPDLTAKLHFGAGAGQYEIAGLVRKITTAPGATEKSGWGYAVAASGFIPVLAKDKFMFVLSAGRNSGRQLGGIVPDAVLIGTQLAGVDAVSGLVSYRHFWSETLRSNLTYSWIGISNPSGVSAGTAAGLNKSFRTANMNLFWAVTPQVDMGMELLHASRTVETGIKGSINRFLFASKYYF